MEASRLTDNLLTLEENRQLRVEYARLLLAHISAGTYNPWDQVCDVYLEEAVKKVLAKRLK